MIFLAIRYLLARRKQTLLTLLGIFFGAAAYIAISGFMLGFRWYLVDQLINNNAHVLVQAREDFLTEHSLDESFYRGAYKHIFWDTPPSGRKDNAMVENPQSWYLRLQADPRVGAYTPQLSAAVIFRNGKSEVPATLIGCDPAGQKKVTTLADYVIEGSFDDLTEGGNRLVLGKDLMDKLGVRVSQNVMVALANANPTPFKVVAAFRTGTKQTDTQAFGALGDVQRVNKTLNQVNAIAVKVRDPAQAAALASSWADIGPEKVESWDQMNQNIFNIFRIQDTIRFMSIGSILIVAGFGIYNVLNMTVVQKRKDIAILRSMGYGTREIISLFFSQGLIVGTLGAATGLVFGYLVCRYLETVPFSGGPLGAGTGYLIISFDPGIYVFAALLAVLSSTIASILPAHAAGKLTPIAIIRAGTE